MERRRKRAEGGRIERNERDDGRDARQSDLLRNHGISLAHQEARISELGGPTSLPSALAASTSLLTSFCTVCAPTFSRAHSGCHVLLAKMSRASSSAERNRVGSDFGDARTDCTAVRVVLPAARRRVVEEAKLSRNSRNPAVRTSGALDALSRAVKRSCHLGTEAPCSRSAFQPGTFPPLRMKSMSPRPAHARSYGQMLGA